MSFPDKRGLVDGPGGYRGHHGGGSRGGQGQKGGAGGGSGGGGFGGFGGFGGKNYQERLQQQLRAEMERRRKEEAAAKAAADAAAAKAREDARNRALAEAAAAKAAKAAADAAAAAKAREDARNRELAAAKAAADAAAAKAREDARNRELAEAEAARKQKLAEERQARLQKEEEEARALRQVTTDRTKANLSESLVNKLAPDTLKSLIAGGHGISGNVFGGLDDDTKEKVVDVVQSIDRDIATQANIVRTDLDRLSGLGFFGPLKPNEQPTTSSLASQSIDRLTDKQKQQLIDRGFDLDNLAFTPGEGLFGLKQQPLIRDINTGETVARTSEAMTGPIGAGLAALGVDTRGISFPTDPAADRGGRQDERLRTLEQQQQQQQQQEQQEQQQEVLSGFTGAERGSSPQFISSLPVSGIATAPNVSNYMDYLKSAFTPVNLASPFGGTFSSNPIYRAAQGGFIGFMDEPLNIMYPSNGNMVVHDGISGILKKYKEIRSEL